MLKLQRRKNHAELSEQPEPKQSEQQKQLSEQSAKQAEFSEQPAEQFPEQFPEQSEQPLTRKTKRGAPQ
jgi:hypothetical protein